MSKKLSFFRKSLVLGLFALLSQLSLAQGQQEWLDLLTAEEREAIDAIALYPVEVRAAILEAAGYPDVLVRLEAMQGKTQADFERLIEPFMREDQEAIWNLTRYPGLLTSIAKSNATDEQSLRALMEDYPEEIHQDAIRLGKGQPDLIREIDRMQEEAGKAMDVLLQESGMGDTGYRAFNTLLDNPEVMSILLDNMRMTVLIGSMYSRNPKAVEDELASRQLELAKQQASEIQSWKDSLAANPQAAEEFQLAAENYAADHGYEETLYQQEYARPRVIERHVWRPYRWWFGYPTWYTRPYWRPYPWWYHWGYYYGPGGEMMVFGTPSWYFGWWHFRYHRNHFYYSNFSSHCVSFYNRHRNSSSGIVAAVDGWVTDNRGRLSRDFLASDGRRAERFKELGRFEMEYQKDSRKVNGKLKSRDQYLTDHQKKYPNLQPGTAERAVVPFREPVQDAMRRPVPTQEPPEVQPVSPNWSKPRNFDVRSGGRRTATQPSRPTISSPEPRSIRMPRFPKAQDLHQRTWQRVSPPRGVRSGGVRSGGSRTPSPRPGGGGRLKRK